MPDLFVLGSPRSGTSLLRTMLDGHPDIFIPAETHFFPVLRRLTALCRHRHGRTIFIRLAFANGSLKRSGFTQSDALELFEAKSTESSATPLEQLDHTLRELASANILGDKTPSYALNASALLKSYPDARVVWITRRRESVVRSLLGIDWGPDTVAAASYVWMRCELQHRKLIRSHPVLSLSYEDLVRSPDDELARVCEFLEIAFHENMTRPQDRAADAIRLHNYPENHQRLFEDISAPAQDAPNESYDDVNPVLGWAAYQIYRCQFIKPRLKTIGRWLGESVRHAA